MLSLEEISARLEIQDLTTSYCNIIDQREFDKLTGIFTEDAFIDYTAMGGIKGNTQEIIEFLGQSMDYFSNYQHMISNYQITLNIQNGKPIGASGRIMCLNPMSPRKQDSNMLFLGFWYIDEYVNTQNGWRISRRVEEKSYAKQVSSKAI